MGEIQDCEGNGVRCPFCESADDCPHLLAVVDLSYGTLGGGRLYDHWDEIARVLNGRFTTVWQDAGRKPVRWLREELQEIWSQSETTGQDDLEIDFSASDALLRLFLDLFFEAGAEIIEASEEEASGHSYAMKLAYAWDAPVTVKRAVGEVSRLIHSELRLV